MKKDYSSIMIENDALRALFESGQNENRASILDSVTQGPADFQIMGPFDLTTAPRNPVELPGVFRTVMMLDATDDDVEVSFIPHDDRIGNRLNALPFKKGQSITFGRTIGRGFLDWDAQSGKTATFVVSVSAEIRLGTISTNIAGGVNILDGTGVSTEKKTLAAATASEIFPSSGTRKTGTFVNTTGAPIYVGPSTVSNAGADEGMQIAPGATFIWKNTAALYGYSVAGADIVTLVET